MKERWKLLLMILVFLSTFYIPFKSQTVQNAVIESLLMLQEYAREHILLCLVPAFFIAGGIAVFVSQDSVIKYFGAQAKKWISYSVASVSGTILAVCSCTILPLFAGIYKRGAGIGPATAFLYSGPAINVLAIILTARILGIEMGIARALGAIVFAVVIGLLMHVIFLKEEKEKVKNAGAMFVGAQDEKGRPLIKEILYFAVMIGILVFANWSKAGRDVRVWNFIFIIKWYIVAGLLVLLIYILVSWFKKDELKSWVDSTWGFTKQILPLLFAGVVVAGFLLGRPGHEGIIPSQWIESLVGGNSLFSNFFASITGAFMYFATLTEVPILQGLLGAGMGKGPALALLLAGPALSLPNMIVINSVLGLKKTMTFIGLVVVMATLSGIIFGTIFA